MGNCNCPKGETISVRSSIATGVVLAEETEKSKSKVPIASS